ncbi:NADH-quinone oxidoreductase subunit A [Vibrio marisflavi]|uniref:NADH-quinone oxidoreductase subunit n=1 Tax=Vibrio marisflavi CECT 7928 TaxID=634439 RepID=A0ABM9A0P5_9VIBR|nr:NADH-quinone oxidoreductase subunit A [Vibrio marisflavi]CAH0537081.1 NAD(P)H-quinone oxidoreductase subunit 3, chloroplastic [Vibrio marisflavi CECT 7928]
MSGFSPALLIGIFTVLVIAVISAILFASKLVGGFGRRYEDEQPFECGLLPSGTTKHNFSISYYLIAVAFLIFELEAAILLAWGVDYWKLGIPGVIAAVLFIVILLLGLVYMLRKGAFKIGVYES